MTAMICINKLFVKDKIRIRSQIIRDALLLGLAFLILLSVY